MNLIERHSDIAWPVISKINHDHREYIINLENKIRKILLFFVLESNNISRTRKSILYYVVSQFLRLIFVYLNVELNTTAGYYYNKLLDLTNTFCIIRIYNSPNS
jgi:hypothetical protein